MRFPTAKHLAAFVIAAHVLSSAAARAQPADPTAIKLTPRVLEVDDPDALLKSAANDVINTIVLPDEGQPGKSRKFRLVALSFEILDQALQEFNRFKYGAATVFLKGGLALYVHYYMGGQRSKLASVATPALLKQCDAAFTASDIDFNVTTQWKTISSDNPYVLSRDPWLTGGPDLEYGYELLNDRVLSALESIRARLYKESANIVVPEGHTGQPEVVQVEDPLSPIAGLNSDFRGDKTRTPAFLRKWADFLAADIRWTDVIISNDLVSYSHRAWEYPDDDVDFDWQPQNYVVNQMDLDQREPKGRIETKEEQIAEVRNITLPDRVMLPGPNLHLLYTHRRGTGLHSIYITSNYSQTWPSDPSLDPHRFTKFALHRLKLVLPFRYAFAKPETMTKPVTKIMRHSLEVTEEDDFDTTSYMNLFGVGGELVDVGVDHPIASLSHEPVDPSTLVPLTLDSELRPNAKVVVKVAGRDWLMHDLKDTIFDVVGLPWKKKKPEKRLTRFLCMAGPDMAAQAKALGDFASCLQQLPRDQRAQCRSVFPNVGGLVKDFFIGDGLDGPPTGYSLYSIMYTLPDSELEPAEAYLQRIIEFLDALAKR